jgi:hypothetical protein
MIELSRDLSGADQIAEQHRQMAPLAGISRLNGRSFRLRYVDDCMKRSPASVAEVGTRLVDRATGRTH